jgi:YHS domain-containing protein
MGAWVVLSWLVRIVILLLVLRALVRLVAGVLQGLRGSPAAGPIGGRARRRAGSSVPLVRDPVCGTFVMPGRALTSQARATTHYFCSESCRQTFEREHPESRSA